MKTVVTPELKAMMMACASSDNRIAVNARAELAKGFQKGLRDRFDLVWDKAQALETPLKKGNLNGDVVSWIYEMVKFEAGVNPTWPLDFVAPGTESDYRAYTMPGHGKIPEYHVEGDYVTAQFYPVAASIDCNLDYLRDGRWDIVSRMGEVLDLMVTRKLNDDGFAVLLTAAYDRNLMIFDADAAVGQFTKRLVSLMKTEQRRQGGGNVNSLFRKKLTDLLISVEAMEDIRNWGVDQLDELSRREIYVAEDGAINRIFSVNIHDMDELGVGQPYQKFFTDTLVGSLGSTDVELVLGLDLQRNDGFVMPVRDEWEVHEDATFQRRWQYSLFGRMRVGFAALDNRLVLAGSF